MYACKETTSDNIALLAWAPAEDVWTDTGAPSIDEGENHNNSTISNGSDRYYRIKSNGRGSVGFSRESDGVNKYTCDYTDTDPEFRLCWHLNLGGWRCGDNTDLSSSAEWIKIIYSR